MFPVIFPVGLHSIQSWWTLDRVSQLILLLLLIMLLRDGVLENCSRPKGHRKDDKIWRPWPWPGALECGVLELIPGVIYHYRSMCQFS